MRSREYSRHLVGKMRSFIDGMRTTDNLYVRLAKFVAVLVLLGVLGVVALCIRLAIPPKSPNYTIVDITIPNLDNGSQNVSILYALAIQNPNKDCSIYYDQTLLAFFYGPHRVGEKTLPPFHQGRGKTRLVIDYVNADPQVLNAIRHSISKATAELKVDVLTRVRYKAWGIKRKHRGLDMQGSLTIGSDGKISSKKNKLNQQRPSKNSSRSRKPKRKYL